MFLHNHKSFKDLIEITASEQKIINPSLVEKDYFIMHVLYSLLKLNLKIELKGGTSLSKGFGIIERFSEDLDIKIEPDQSFLNFDVKTGKNHDKEAHRESRKKFFDNLSIYLENKIDGIIEVKRDEYFDDSKKYRNGGIRLFYNPIFNLPEGIKEGILLEVGFDKTTPNRPKDISSWALAKARPVLGDQIIENRALNVFCYEPKYTFVEKLQAIVRKYRLYKEQSETRTLPENFLRHYYDIYCLLSLDEVRSFIGTSEYIDYKNERFGSDDVIIKNCQGIFLNDPKERALFENEYVKSSALYYRGQIPFEDILKRIQSFSERL